MTEHAGHELEQLVSDYEQLGAVGDLEGRSRLFHENAAFFDPVGLLEEFSDLVEPGRDGLGPAFRGRPALIAFWKRVRAVFPGMSAEVLTRLVSSETSTIAFEWQGTYPCDGEQRRVRAIDVFQVRDGLIAEVRGYMARADSFTPPRTNRHVPRDGTAY